MTTQPNPNPPCRCILLPDGEPSTIYADCPIHGTGIAPSEATVADMMKNVKPTGPYGSGVHHAPSQPPATDPLMEILTRHNKGRDASEPGITNDTHAALTRYIEEQVIGPNLDVVNIWPFPNWQITDQAKFEAAAAEIINWQLARQFHRLKGGQ